MPHFGHSDASLRRPRSAQPPMDGSQGTGHTSQVARSVRMPHYAYDPEAMLSSSIEQQLRRTYDGPEFDANPAHHYTTTPPYRHYPSVGASAASPTPYHSRPTRPASAAAALYGSVGAPPLSSATTALPRRPNSSLPSTAARSPAFRTSTGPLHGVPLHMQGGWSRQQRKEDLVENCLEPLQNLVGIDGYFVRRSPLLHLPMGSAGVVDRPSALPNGRRQDGYGRVHPHRGTSSTAGVLPAAPGHAAAATSQQEASDSSALGGQQAEATHETHRADGGTAVVSDARKAASGGRPHASVESGSVSTSGSSYSSATSGSEVYFDSDPLEDRERQGTNAQRGVGTTSHAAVGHQKSPTPQPPRAPLSTTSAAAKRDTTSPPPTAAPPPPPLEVRSLAQLTRGADGLVRFPTTTGATPREEANSATHPTPTVAVELATLAKQRRRRSIDQLLEELVRLRLQHQRMSHEGVRCPSRNSSHARGSTERAASRGGRGRGGAAAARSRTAASSVAPSRSVSQRRRCTSPQVPRLALSASEARGPHESVYSADPVGEEGQESDDVYVRLFRRYRRCECCEVPLPRELLRPQPPPMRPPRAGGAGRTYRGRRPSTSEAAPAAPSQVAALATPVKPSAPSSTAPSTRSSVRTHPLSREPEPQPDSSSNTAAQAASPHPHLSAFVEQELLHLLAREKGGAPSEDSSAQAIQLLRALVEDVRRGAPPVGEVSQSPADAQDCGEANAGPVHPRSDEEHAAEQEAFDERIYAELLRLLGNELPYPSMYAAYPQPSMPRQHAEPAAYGYAAPRGAVHNPYGYRPSPYAVDERLYPYNIPHRGHRDQSADTIAGPSADVDNETVAVDVSDEASPGVPQEESRVQEQQNREEATKENSVSAAPPVVQPREVEHVGVQTSLLTSRRTSANSHTAFNHEPQHVAVEHLPPPPALHSTEECAAEAKTAEAPTPLEEVVVEPQVEPSPVVDEASGVAQREVSLSSYAASNAAGVTQSPTAAALTPPTSPPPSHEIREPFAPLSHESNPSNSAAQNADLQAAIRLSVMSAQTQLLVEMEGTLRHRLVSEEADARHDLRREQLRQAEDAERGGCAADEARERARLQRSSRYARDRLLVTEMALTEWSRALREEEGAREQLRQMAAEELTSLTDEAEHQRQAAEVAARHQRTLDELEAEDARLRKSIQLTESLVRQELQLSLCAYTEDYTREEAEYVELVERMALQRSYAVDTAALEAVSTESVTSSSAQRDRDEMEEVEEYEEEKSPLPIRTARSDLTSHAEEYSEKFDEAKTSSKAVSEPGNDLESGYDDDDVDSAPAVDRDELGASNEGGRSGDRGAASASFAAVVLEAGGEATLHGSPVEPKPMQATLDESERMSASLLRTALAASTAAVAEAPAIEAETVESSPPASMVVPEVSPAQPLPASSPSLDIITDTPMEGSPIAAADTNGGGEAPTASPLLIDKENEVGEVLLPPEDKGDTHTEAHGDLVEDAAEAIRRDGLPTATVPSARVAHARRGSNADDAEVSVVSELEESGTLHKAARANFPNAPAELIAAAKSVNQDADTAQEESKQSAAHGHEAAVKHNSSVASHPRTSQNASRSRRSPVIPPLELPAGVAGTQDTAVPSHSQHDKDQGEEGDPFNDTLSSNCSSSRGSDTASTASRTAAGSRRRRRQRRNTRHRTPVAVNVELDEAGELRWEEDGAEGSLSARPHASPKPPTPSSRSAAEPLALPPQQSSTSPPWRLVTDNSGLPQTQTFHSGVDTTGSTGEEREDSGRQGDAEGEEGKEESADGDRAATIGVEVCYDSNVVDIDGDQEAVRTGRYDAVGSDSPLGVEVGLSETPADGLAGDADDAEGTSHSAAEQETELLEEQGEDGAAAAGSVTALEPENMLYETSTDDRRFLSPLSTRSEVDTPQVHTLEHFSSYSGTSNTKHGAAHLPSDASGMSYKDTPVPALRDRVQLPSAIAHLQQLQYSLPEAQQMLPSLSASSMSSPHMSELDGGAGEAEEHEERSSAADDDDGEGSAESGSSMSTEDGEDADHELADNTTGKDGFSERRRSSCTGKDEVEMLHQRADAQRTISHDDSAAAGRRSERAGSNPRPPVQCSERRLHPTVSVVDAADEPESARGRTAAKSGDADARYNTEEWVMAGLQALQHRHTTLRDDGEHLSPSHRSPDNDGPLDRSPREGLVSATVSRNSLVVSPASTSGAISRSHVSHFGSLDSDALTMETRRIRQQCWDENATLATQLVEVVDGLPRPPTPEFVRMVLAGQLMGSPMSQNASPAGEHGSEGWEGRRDKHPALQPLPHMQQIDMAERERGIPYEAISASADGNAAYESPFSSGATHETAEETQRRGTPFHHSTAAVAKLASTHRTGPKRAVASAGGSVEGKQSDGREEHRPPLPPMAFPTKGSSPVSSSSGGSSALQRPPFPWEAAEGTAGQPRAAETDELIPLKQSDQGVWGGAAPNRFSQLRVRVPSPHPRALRRTEEDNLEESLSASAEEEASPHLSPDGNDTRLLVAVPNGSLESEELVAAPLQVGVQVYLVDSLPSSSRPPSE